MDYPKRFVAGLQLVDSPLQYLCSSLVLVTLLLRFLLHLQALTSELLTLLSLLIRSTVFVLESFSSSFKESCQ